MGDLLLKTQQRDTFIKELQKKPKLSNKNPTAIDSQWKISEDKLLRYNGKAYVLNNTAIKAEILHMNHDNPKGIYYGYKYTYKTISCHYF